MDPTHERFLAAAQAGDVPTVFTLLVSDATLLEAKTPAGNTALHLAAATGSLEVLMILLRAIGDYGGGNMAPLTAENESGDTPLMMACVGNDPPCVNVLLQSARSFEACCPVKRAVSSHGLGPLELCCIAAPPKCATSLMLCLAFAANRSPLDHLVPLCLKASNHLCLELVLRFDPKALSAIPKGEASLSSELRMVIERARKRADARAEWFARSLVEVSLGSGSSFSAIF